MACPSQGARSRLYIEPGSSPHTFDSSSESYEFVSETLTAKESIITSAGIRGTRTASIYQTRIGETVVSGQIVFEPYPELLNLWLPRILGAAESADTFVPDETLPAFGVLINRVFQTFQYTDCYVDKATFSFARGQLVRLAVDIIGKTLTVGTTAPSVTLPNKHPYVFSEGALTVSTAPSTIEVESGSITIDNAISSRAFNSLTATCLTPQDRIVTGTFNVVPNTWYSASEYSELKSGMAVYLTFVHSILTSTQCGITMPKFCGGNVDPNVGSKGDILMTITGRAFGTGTANTEISINNY